MVAKYVEALTHSTGSRHKLTAQDIGIVTPYQLQANKITEACELILGPNNGILIGTAAVVQGREKQVVIISTVSVGTITEFAADSRVQFQ